MVSASPAPFAGVEAEVGAKFRCTSADAMPILVVVVVRVVIVVVIIIDGRGGAVYVAIV